METVFMELATAVASVLAGWIIGIIRERQVNLDLEDEYARCKLFLEVSGNVLEAIDPKLHAEVVEAVACMRNAYESEAFTQQAFNAIVKECRDVFVRARELVGNRS